MSFSVYAKRCWPIIFAFQPERPPPVKPKMLKKFVGKHGKPQFTPRQATLFGRIEQLCCDASVAEFFPVNITAIRGGGSLFRLEPNPKDADLSIVYSDLQTAAALSFNCFFAEFFKFGRDYERRTTPQDDLQRFVDETKNKEATRFYETYRRWLGDASWASIYKPFQMIAFNVYTHQMSGKPIGVIFCDIMVKSMIRARYPRLQLAELTRDARSAMKMNLTTIWTPGTHFNPVAIASSAGKRASEDSVSLSKDYHRAKSASEYYHRAIQLAINLENSDARKWPTQIEELAEQAMNMLNSDEDNATDVDMPVGVLRKTVKSLWHRIVCQRRLLEEIVGYKTRRYSRTWGLDSRHRSLEQYLATHLFGRMGRERTRMWLPFVADEGLRASNLVHEEQVRLKGKSEVPRKHLQQD
ncbi:MAG: hypothetical protein U0805_23125 [Pirellulales bacterium]